MKPGDKQATVAEIFGRDQGFDIQVLDEMDRQRIRRDARRRLKAEERGEVSLPQPRSLRGAIAAGIPRVEYRIKEWMPRGARVLLAAQHKTGKTTTRDCFLRSMADGDHWLDVNEVVPVSGAVVLIDTEMSEAQGLTWLYEQRIENDDRVQVFFMRGRLQSLDWRDADCRARWVELLKSLHAEVLVLDCIRPILDAFGLDEHKDAGQVLTAIDRLLNEAGIGEALVVQHMGHTGERARGDSRFLDWPDVLWKLVRQDDDPHSQRFISAYGRDVDVPESAVTFDQITRHLSFTGGSRNDAKARTALDALTVLLENSRPLSVRAIQSALADSEHGRDQIRAAIKLGVKERIIVTERGPRRAILHRLCERAAPCGQRAAYGASERAAASIEPHARTLLDDDNEDIPARTVVPFDPTSAFDRGEDMEPSATKAAR